MGFWKSQNARMDGMIGRAINTETPPTLLDAAGGPDAIAMVVNEFYGRVLEDPLLFGYFAHKDQPALRRKLTATLVELLGGERTYSWDLKVAHAGLGITPDAYATVCGHLLGALLALNVRPDVIKALLAKAVDVAPAIIASQAELAALKESSQS